MEYGAPIETPSNARADRQPLEAELIRRVCAGEKELYAELVRPYERSVFLAALSVVGNRDDAEDIAQESFLKAFRALPGFRAEARFSTWLEKIAINESRMRLRRARLEKSQPLPEEEPEEDDYSPVLMSDWREIPSEALERKELRQVLADALLQLPDKYREVVTLRDIRHYSIADTAKILGLTEGTVKTRLLRARLKLRDLLAPLQQNAAITSRNPFAKGRNPW